MYYEHELDDSCIKPGLHSEQTVKELQWWQFYIWQGTQFNPESTNGR